GPKIRLGIVHFMVVHFTSRTGTQLEGRQFEYRLGVPGRNVNQEHATPFENTMAVNQTGNRIPHVFEHRYEKDDIKCLTILLWEYRLYRTENEPKGRIMPAALRH